MTQHAFFLDRPERRLTSVVFASPHSGSDYPASFLRASRLDRQAIRSSEDAFVDRLFSCATEFGAPFLRAAAPRAFMDLNRSPDELDPALIEGLSHQGHNPRIASGLGVIPRVVANGRPIYRGKLTRAEAARRIETFWRPYHATLHELLHDAHRDFGEAILIDCHSMPREATEGVARIKGRRPDIVLGDRFGAAAGRDVVDRIEAAFAAAGFTVARNVPFAGAYVAQAYGRPSRQQHAIQIEIDRSLYMDEASIRPRADFESFRRRLRGIVAEIAAIGGEPMTLAAE